MKDLVVAITGASSGIGADFAEVAGARGAHVVLAARREAELRAVAAKSGTDALAIVADVTRRPDVARVVAGAIERFGRLDVWINNAGRGITRPVAELTDEDVDEMFTVNLKSALYGMQEVLPHFKTRKRGQIINISSMLGRVPTVSMRSAYSAAKAALNSLAVNLRMDLRAEYPEIHVTTILPGVVATDFGLHARAGGPDSRKLPFAQPVREISEIIAAAIENPRAEYYTRRAYRDLAVAYYSAEDMGALEGRPPFVPFKR